MNSLRKSFISVFFILSLGIVWGAGAAVAAPSDLTEKFKEKGLTPQDALALTMSYYTNPQPQKLLTFLEVMLGEFEFVKEPERARSFCHFIATVAHNDPWFFDGVKRLKELSVGPGRDVALRIVQEAEAYRSASPDTEEGLNDLWSEFFATGSSEVLSKIISVLGLDGKTENASRIDAARGSLAYCAASQPKVYNALREAASAEGASEVLKSRISEVMALPQEIYRRQVGRYGFMDEEFLKEKLGRLDAAIAADPKEAANYLSRGNAKALNYDYEGALADFHKALELNPHLPIANNFICFILISQNKCDKAESYCLKAIEQSPNFSKPYFNLARIHDSRRDYAKAIESVTKAISIQKNFPEAYVMRAGYYEKAGDLKKALADLEEAKKTDPKNKGFVEREIYRVQQKIASE